MTPGGTPRFAGCSGEVLYAAELIGFFHAEFDPTFKETIAQSFSKRNTGSQHTIHLRRMGRSFGQANCRFRHHLRRLSVISVKSGV